MGGCRPNSVFSKTKLLLISLIAVGASAATTFVNPGFENGNLSSWDLSSTDWNCVVLRTGTSIPGCPNDAGKPRTPAKYVHSGNYGLMLGGGEPGGLISLTQTLSVTVAGNYRVSFYYRELDYYPDPVDDYLEVVYGPDLDHLTTVWSVSDRKTMNWKSVTSPAISLTPGNYVVGFRFYDVFGEWALDDTNFYKNPEPGSLALMAAPIALLFWRLKSRASAR